MNSSVAASVVADENGHEDIAKALIAKGCRLDIVDFNGDSILHQASEKGHHSTVQTLIRHKVELDMKDKNGKTALMRAKGNRKSEVVKLLLDSGARMGIH